MCASVGGKVHGHTGQEVTTYPVLQEDYQHEQMIEDTTAVRKKDGSPHVRRDFGGTSYTARGCLQCIT